MKHFFIIFSFIFILGVPLISHTKSVDQRCWKKTECLTYRKDIWGITDPQGFYLGTDAISACSGLSAEATDPWGFCMPATIAKTGISFGGKTEFMNIGEFIQYIYKYGFIIGTVLATVMIIFSGVMWVLSGGSQDVIGSAKKRIGGAVIGLVLMALSYTILNIVNPYLVNLRLPQVWLVNDINVPPNFCKDDPNTKVAFAYPASQEKTITDQQKEQLFSKIKASSFQKPNEMKPNPLCGNKYFIEGGTNTCGGNYCESPNKSCIPFDISKEDGDEQYVKIPRQQLINESACWEGELIIHYKVASLEGTTLNKITKNLAGPIEQSADDVWLEDRNDVTQANNDIVFFPVCENNSKKRYLGKSIAIKGKVAQITSSGKFDEFLYRFPIVMKNAVMNCEKSDDLVGVLILNKINVNWSPVASLVLLYKPDTSSEYLEGLGISDFQNMLITLLQHPELLSHPIPVNALKSQFYTFILNQSIIDELQ